MNKTVSNDGKYQALWSSTYPYDDENKDLVIKNLKTNEEECRIPLANGKPSSMSRKSDTPCVVFLNHPETKENLFTCFQSMLKERVRQTFLSIFNLKGEIIIKLFNYIDHPYSIIGYNSVSSETITVPNYLICWGWSWGPLFLITIYKIPDLFSVPNYKGITLDIEEDFNFDKNSEKMKTPFGEFEIDYFYDNYQQLIDDEEQFIWNHKFQNENSFLKLLLLKYCPNNYTDKVNEIMSNPVGFECIGKSSGETLNMHLDSLLKPTLTPDDICPEWFMRSILLLDLFVEKSKLTKEFIRNYNHNLSQVHLGFKFNDELEMVVNIPMDIIENSTANPVPHKYKLNSQSKWKISFI